MQQLSRFSRQQPLSISTQGFQSVHAVFKTNTTFSFVYCQLCIFNRSSVSLSAGQLSIASLSFNGVSACHFPIIQYTRLLRIAFFASNSKHYMSWFVSRPVLSIHAHINERIAKCTVLFKVHKISYCILDFSLQFSSLWNSR